MTPANLALRIDQGATFRALLRLMQPNPVYKPITAIAATGPVRLTVEHGLPGDWPVWVEHVRQLPEANRAPLRQLPHMAQVVTATELDLPGINATGTRPEGGQLVYRPPLDLTDATAELRLYEKGAEVGTLPVTVNAGGWVDVELSAAETAALAWRSREYVLDVTLPNGDVLRAYTGTITVEVAGAAAGQVCHGFATTGGDRGQRGERGAQVVGSTFDEEGRLIMTLDDGSMVASDPSPVVETVIEATDTAVAAAGESVSASNAAVEARTEALAASVTAVERAGQSVSSASESAASAELASTEANRAALAADTSVGNADVYSDTTAGLAATSEGQQFQVLSADSSEFIRYRHNPGPVAFELGRYPSSTSIGALQTGVAALDEKVKDSFDPWPATIEDDQGGIAAGVDEQGVFHAPGGRFESLETPSLTFARPSSGYGQTVSDAQGGEAYGVDTEGRFHAPEVVTRALNGVPVGSYAQRALELFAANRVGFANEGQSNAAGQSPAVHTAQAHDCVGFPAHSTAPAALLPMTAANCSSDSNREVPAFGALDYLKQLVLSEIGLNYTDHEYQTVLMNTAYSGYTIAQLSTGTDSYDEFVGQLQAAYDISQSDGKTFVHLANFWTQGEGDYRSSWEGYFSELLSYHEGRQAAARSITGQAEPVYTVASQMNSSGVDYVQSVALAALRAAEAHPHIVLACPTYIRDFIDDVHGSGASLDIEGAYLGLAAFLTLVRGQKFDPLKAVSSRLQGRVQEVTFNKAGLVLATSATVPAIPQYGFQMVTPGGSEIALESAEVTGPSTVRFVWDSAPPPGSMWWAGGKRITSGKGIYLGSCINLRDSQGDHFTYKSNPLHNWAVVQTIDPRGI